MQEIYFQQVYDSLTGGVSTQVFIYSDENGTIWYVPYGAGHRFEVLLDEWLAAGNTIRPYDNPTAAAATT